MQPFSIEQLYSTRAIGGAAWSPDGKQIAFIANISGRRNIWVVPSGGGQIDSYRRVAQFLKRHIPPAAASSSRR